MQADMRIPDGFDDLWSLVGAVINEDDFVVDAF